MVTTANQSDDLALDARILLGQFLATPLAARLRNGFPGEIGALAKACGAATAEVRAWLADEAVPPPHQTRVFLAAVYAREADLRRAPLAVRGGGGDEPAQVRLTGRFVFDAPAMPPDGWQEFARHLAGSAVRYANAARIGGGSGSVPVAATVNALAAGVAAATPGQRARISVPGLDDRGREGVRVLLQRARARAEPDPLDFDRPAVSNPDVDNGLRALYEQWCCDMNYRDPKTGWRPPKRPRVLDMEG